MLTERLQERCSSARLIGLASVTCYRLEFSKRSIDKSGKATLVKSTDQSAQIFGVVFEIARDDLDELDRLEGRGYGYDRIEDLTASAYPDQTPLTVTTYIAHPNYLEAALQPYDWYKALVVAGSKQHKLPQDYHGVLTAVTSSIDPDLNRRTRLEALALLEKLERSDEG